MVPADHQLVVRGVDADGGAALAGALARIDRVARRLPMQAEPAQAPKYLVHPLTGRAAWTALFTTHPPVEQRIARLLDLR